MSEAEARMRVHDAYDLGDCLWHIYRMIGKLSGRVYMLSAPDDFGVPGRTAGSAEPIG